MWGYLVERRLFVVALAGTIAAASTGAQAAGLGVG